MKKIIKKTLLASALVALTGSSMAASKDITFLNWVTAEPSNKPVIQGLIDKTEVPVNVLDSSWGDMQKNIYLRLRTRQPLDVSQLQARWLPTLGKMPNLVDFNDIYGKNFLESQIPAEVLEAGRLDGKQLGLPWNTGSISLVANKKMLDESGIGKAPKTIDEFVSSLRKVKSQYPESTPYALMTKSNNLISGDFQLWLWAHGGKIFDDKNQLSINSEETVETLNFLKLLIDEKLANLDTDRGAARRLFGQESAAYYFDAPVARGFARDFSGKGADYDQYVLPMQTPVAEEGMTSHAMQWGHLLVMMKSDAAKINGKLSKDSKAAKFVEGLTMNADIQLDYFKKSGAIPGSLAARSNELISKDDYIVNWNASLGLPKRNELSAIKNSANYIAVVSEEVQSVILGKKDAEKAAADMESRMKRLMK
ncbi:hypothetical protein EOPP23_01245 [Endozoicomonas sp. OPT23]|uniref:ABC transporter substrate-binding protein n=1 Tax=Endozoicomonas sp. OPT23 TaxID=2072845 RepID=UPI00129BFC55|nr:extracellular solute-binding protein [Endozoicomonas sp. OPT23]MRI31618.1 hypothetical protein [Endozoicomonas sp. OPT23]